MGIRMGMQRLSRCSCSDPGDPATIRANRFEVLNFSEINGYTVVMARYEDARNFGGRKVLLYDAPWSQVQKQKFLDPHFCEDDSHLSPIARFRPDDVGWVLAHELARRTHTVHVAEKE